MLSDIIYSTIGWFDFIANIGARIIKTLKN